MPIKRTAQRRNALKYRTPEEAAEDAERNIDYGMPDKACKIYERAIIQFGEKPILMDGFGELLVSLGDVDRAKEVFMKAIKLQPNSGAVKYLNMAQLSVGEESISFYQKALGILLNEKAQMERNPQLKSRTEEICSAIASCYCGMAETYNALNRPNESEPLLVNAITISPTNSEPLLLFAQLRLSQNKLSEANEFLKKSYLLWQDPETTNERPPFLLQFNTAKMFMTLQDFQMAADVLENMLNQQDNVIEVWSLLAMAYSHFDVLSAIDSIDKAKELLKTLEEPDPEMEKEVLDNEKYIRSLPIPKTDEKDGMDEENDEEME